MRKEVVTITCDVCDGPTISADACNSGLAVHLLKNGQRFDIRLDLCAGCDEKAEIFYQAARKILG